MSQFDNAIDQEVFRFFAKWKRQMKMAMLIASIEKQLVEQGIELTHDFIANRIYTLVEEGVLHPFGDITKWRRSEIDLVEGTLIVK